MTLIDKAEAHHDDLIRRGDAQRAVNLALCKAPLKTKLDLFDALNDTKDALATLPAVTVDYAALLRDVPVRGRANVDGTGLHTLVFLKDVFAALPPAKQDDLASGRAVTVTVKPLVWKQEADNAWVAAHYAIHQYWPHNNGPFSVSGYLGGLGSMSLGKHPTLEAAKAAAQADYAARILAALEPVASPDPAAIREAALREAAEVCAGIRQRIANGPMPEGARFDYEQAILTLITEKPHDRA